MLNANHKQYTCLLAIESSCDETSAAIYLPKDNRIEQEIYSQVKLHQDYGGVVPELAARSHLEKLYGVIENVLARSSCSLSDLDAIAYTRGPGLVGPLLIGATYADALAFALNVPLIPVHHLEAHITITMFEYPKLQFPFLSLLVSGGHTELILAKRLGDYQLLGSTLDDAAGEAFDKCGKIMGLDYPAGPELSLLADQISAQEPLPLLPEPLKGKKTLDFSFSGLKTAFSRRWQHDQHNYSKPAFAAAIQSAIVNALVNRVAQAFHQYPDLPLVLAGGVAANRMLRKNIERLSVQENRSVYFPSLCYCTDNAGMIVHNAYLHSQHAGVPDTPWQKVQPRWPIESLSCIEKK